MKPLTPQMRRAIEFATYLSILATFFLIALRDLTSTSMLAFPDLVAFPPSPGVGFSYFSASWNVSGFGGPSTAGNSVYWWSALEIVLKPWSAQRLFFLSLLPGSGLAMYWASKEFVKLFPTRITLGIAYSLNTFAIGQFSAGEGALLFYAVLPFIFVFWRHSIVGTNSRSRWMNGIGFVLTSGFAWTVYANGIVVLSLLLALPLLGFILLSPALRLRALLVTFLGSAGSLALNLRILASPIIAQGGALAGSSGFLSATQAVYAYEVPNPLGLYFLIAGAPLGLLLAGASLCGLVWVRPAHRRVYFELALTGLGISVLMWSVGTGLLLQAFRFAPIATFRDPHTAAYSTVIAVILSSGISIESGVIQLRGWLSRERPAASRRTRLGLKWIKTSLPTGAAVALAAVVLCSSAQPIMSGTLGLSPQENYQVQTFPYSPYLPPSFVQAQDYLVGQGYYSNAFNVLWLPLPYYVNARDVWTANLDSSALRSLNDSDAGQITSSLQSMFASPTQPLGSMLAEASVRYIVIDLDSPFTGPINVETPTNAEIDATGYYPLYIFGSPSAFLGYFSNSSQFQVSLMAQNVAIFQNLAYFGLVHGYGQIALQVSSNSSGLAIPLGPNKLSNANFSSGINPWEVGGDVSVENSSSLSPASWANLSSGSVIDQFYSRVEEYHTYDVGITVSGTLSRSWAIKILWFNRTVEVPTDAQAVGSSYIYPTSGILFSRGWLNYSGSAAAPGTAQFAAFILYAGGNGGGGQFLLATNLSFQGVYLQTSSREMPGAVLSTWANVLSESSQPAISLYSVPSSLASPGTREQLQAVGGSALYQDEAPGCACNASLDYVLQRLGDTALPLTSSNLNATPFTSATGTVLLPPSAGILDPITIPGGGSWNLDLYGDNLTSISLSVASSVVAPNALPGISTLTSLGLQERSWTLVAGSYVRVNLSLKTSGPASVMWLFLVPALSDRTYTAPTVLSLIDDLASQGSIDLTLNLTGHGFLVVNQALGAGWVISGVQSSNELSLGPSTAYRISGEGPTRLVLTYTPTTTDDVLLAVEFGAWIGLIGATLIITFDTQIAHAIFRKYGSRKK